MIIFVQHDSGYYSYLVVVFIIIKEGIIIAKKYGWESSCHIALYRIGIMEKNLM
jgi:hypothetical protein